MIYRIVVCVHPDLYWATLHTSDLTISSVFEQMAGHLIICPHTLTHTRTHSREHMPQRPLGRARVPEASSAFPFGKSEQLNRPPWLKVARWLWPFVPPPNFFTEEWMCRRKERRPAVTPPRPPPLWLIDPGAAGGLRALPWKGHQRILSCLRTLFLFSETTRAAGWTFCAFYESVCVRPPAAYRLLYLVVIAEMLVSFDLISCFRSDFKRVCSRAAGK